MRPAPSRARLKCASIATRRISIATPWKRRSVWVATRGFSRPFANAPEVGQLVLGGGEPYAIRYAREKVEAGGRTIVLVTDKPVFFVGGRTRRRQAASRIRSGRAPDSAGRQGTGERDDGGGGARASRWRRRRAARRLRRGAHRADQRHAKTVIAACGRPVALGPSGE